MKYKTVGDFFLTLIVILMLISAAYGLWVLVLDISNGTNVCESKTVYIPKSTGKCSSVPCVSEAKTPEVEGLAFTEDNVTDKYIQYENELMYCNDGAWEAMQRVVELEKEIITLSGYKAAIDKCLEYQEKINIAHNGCLQNVKELQNSIGICYAQCK